MFSIFVLQLRQDCHCQGASEKQSNILLNGLLSNEACLIPPLSSIHVFKQTVQNELIYTNFFTCVMLKFSEYKYKATKISTNKY